MNIDFIQKTNGIIMRVSGSLDYASSQAFAKKCYDLLKLETPNIAIDLREISYMGSASVCAVVAVGKKIQARQGGYYLSLSNDAAKAMEFGGFKATFPVIDDPEDVIE